MTLVENEPQDLSQTRSDQNELCIRDYLTEIPVLSEEWLQHVT
jgi:hypothetical protein